MSLVTFVLRTASHRWEVVAPQLMGRSVRERRSGCDSGRAVIREVGQLLTVGSLALAFGVACAIRGPTPLPWMALGCYAVSANGWTAETGEVVGFSELPEVIALDTIRSAWESVVLVPKDWSWEGPNKINNAGWSSTLRGDWMHLPGDTIIMMRSKSVFHELANDSIIVRWSWLGSVNTFLAQTADGYAGFAQITPRELSRNLPPLWVRLKRMGCADWTGSALIDPRSLSLWNLRD